MTRLHIGTDASAGGTGLHPLDYSGETGWVLGAVFPGARNTSFAAYSTRHDLYYLVDEQDQGALCVFRETNGCWHRLAGVSTYGAGPTYVALNADEDRLAVANYDSGSIAVFRIDPETGVPIDGPDVRGNTGSGPVEDRQEGPHAHCVWFGPDGRSLYHVDLGTDEILAYPVGADASIGDRRVAFAAPAGSGPRHIVFHPTRPFALLVSELASTLTLLKVGNGELTAIDACSTLPDGYAGKSIAGHVSLNRSGTRVYVTNRGHDSIAVFDVETDGMPELLQHRPSGGASPRAFVLLEVERQFVVANEESGSVTIFDLLPDGTLSPCRQHISVAGAVFPFVASRGR